MPDSNFDRLVSAVAQRLTESTGTMLMDRPSEPEVCEQEIDSAVACITIPTVDGVVQKEEVNTPLGALTGDEAAAIALQFASQPAPVRRDDFPIEKIEILGYAMDGDRKPTDSKRQAPMKAINLTPDQENGVNAGINLEYFSSGALRQPECDMLALIAGKTPTPLSVRSPEDSSELLNQLLACWQILPSITSTQMDEALVEILLPKDHIRLRNARLAVTAFVRAQIVAVQPLIQAFEQHGLQYSLLKGGATAFLLYPEPHMRAAWDFDIGVEQHNLRKAEAIAHEVGYQAAQQDPKTNRFYRADPNLRAMVEATHYELGFLVRRLQVTNLPLETLEAIRTEPWTWQYWFDIENGVPWCYASLDIHYALSLDIALDDLLAHTCTLSVSGQTLRVPDDAWLAAHLVFKIYWEGVHNYRKGLYEYADLVRLIPRLEVGTFERLVNILGKHNLLAAGYYVFRRIPLFGISLPEHIIRFIAETELPPVASNPIRLNDLGDMWPKLWGRR